MTNPSAACSFVPPFFRLFCVWNHPSLLRTLSHFTEWRCCLIVESKRKPTKIFKWHCCQLVLWHGHRFKHTVCYPHIFVSLSSTLKFKTKKHVYPILLKWSLILGKKLISRSWDVRENHSGPTNRYHLLFLVSFFYYEASIIIIQTLSRIWKFSQQQTLLAFLSASFLFLLGKEFRCSLSKAGIALVPSSSPV